MKKILLTAAALFCLAQSVTALNWGGIISNTSKPSTSDFANIDFYQSNGVTLWAGSTINKNMRFIMEGLYKYEANFYKDSNTFSNVLDLSLLKLSGSWAAGNGILALNAGRFAYSDASGLVYAQESDGLAVSFQNNSLKVGAYAGYTGLLNSLNVSMTEVKPGAPSKFYSLCSSYIPLVVDFSLLNLAGNNITLQGEYFVSAEKLLKSKAYANLSVNGAITPVLGYSLTAVAGSEDFKNFMMYAKGALSCYIGQSLIASAGCEYASGANGSLSPFITLSKRTAYNGKMFSDPSGTIIPQASVVFVHNSLLLSLAEKLVISMPADKTEFRGSDTTLSFVCNVLSDLQVGTTFIAYADFVDAANSNYSVALNVALSF